MGQSLMVTDRARTSPVTTSFPVTPAIDVAVYKDAPNVPVEPSNSPKPCKYLLLPSPSHLSAFSINIDIISEK